MELNYTAPSVVLSCGGVLFLAYTNRFLGLSTISRAMHRQYLASPDAKIRAQTQNFFKRIKLLRNSQALLVLSLLFCVLSIICLFLESQLFAKISFGLGLGAFSLSLALSVQEIYISASALEIELEDMNLHHKVDPALQNHNPTSP